MAPFNRHLKFALSFLLSYWCKHALGATQAPIDESCSSLEDADNFGSKADKDGPVDGLSLLSLRQKSTKQLATRQHAPIEPIPSTLNQKTRLLEAAPQANKYLDSMHAKSKHAHAQQDSMPQVAWRAFEALAEEQRHRLEEGSKEGATPFAPDAPGSVFEAVEVSLPLEPPVLKHDRNTGSGQGDKNIVGLFALTRGGRQCVVYGLGIADDSGFEQQMQEMGCETHAFDCTVDPASPVVANKNFKFHNWCIGQKENVSMQGSVYVKTDEKTLKFKSLAETMKELGHTHIDLLKFDIEGFEWQLFQTQLLGSDAAPEQLSFELHTAAANPAYVPHKNVADKGFVEVNRLFKSLFDLGYRVTSKELNSGDPACAEFIAVKVSHDAV